MTEDSIAPLPAVVRKWLQRSNVIGKEMINAVHMHQRGQMRTKPHGRWMPVEAEQYTTTENPAFYWEAKVQMAPLFHLSGRDKYENGKGQMLIKLLSLIPIVNARGPTIDQGALVRYLAEISWVPTAALAEYIEWEALDSSKVRAKMTYGGIIGSAVFAFDEEGDLATIDANRYYERKAGATMENWHI